MRVMKRYIATLFSTCRYV